jgi:hypothetical protein
MASSRRTSNDGSDAPDTERVSTVHKEPAVEQPTAEEEASALVRRSLDILEDVYRLLQALSPSEIEAAVTRVYLGRAGEEGAGLCWHLYAKRHRVLVDLFAQQHSAFARAARAHFQRSAPRQKEEQ